MLENAIVGAVVVLCFGYVVARIRTAWRSNGGGCGGCGGKTTDAPSGCANGNDCSICERWKKSANCGNDGGETIRPKFAQIRTQTPRRER
ncbi:MAG: hypothetical protein IKU86_02405 [Thermoguttaceae bacterium]|nr:hypothetical protein [Thermoguttaceae bacterium]